MIPFNKPTFTDLDLRYFSEALNGGHSSGNGPFTRRAEKLLEGLHGGGTALLTTSCTHALELSARLLDLQPGDEVIVPSYTFVSTASAFMWNGARPVFADVDAQTLNIDPKSAEALINERTRAICIVHYAGVGAKPEQFADLADKYGLTLIEDNAHGLGASHNGRTLGTFGSMSTLSFHETKNITCGEGGALILNDPALIERAEILREKGTNRTNFMRGQVDKYTWVDNGSSWVISDLLASLLTGQLERVSQVNADRISIWDRYNQALHDWARNSESLLPYVPPESLHTGHMYFLRLRDQEVRDQFIEHLRRQDVTSVFHYQSLHSSPVGVTLKEDARQCVNSDRAAQTLARLPMFAGMSEQQQDHIIAAILSFEP
jgi:dTDP-4-amino-4,6-dideoxygalactose transaminase